MQIDKLIEKHETSLELLGHIKSYRGMIQAKEDDKKLYEAHFLYSKEWLDHRIIICEMVIERLKLRYTKLWQQ